MSEEEKTNIIFIGGTGRSGTNLIKEILGEHPDVATMPFEYRFTLDPNGIVDCYNTLQTCWSPYIAHKKISELEKLMLRMGSKNIFNSLLGKIITKIDLQGTLVTSPPYFDWELEKWFPNYNNHVNQMIKELKEYSYNASWPGEEGFKSNNEMTFASYPGKSGLIFRKFLRSLVKDLLMKVDKKVFIEDNTWNILFCKDLKEILPEAKFIHMIRDPRDVIASFLQQRWTPSDLKNTISYYSSLMERIIESSNSISNSDIKTVKLESLVSDSVEVLNDIHEFFGLVITANKIKKDLSHSGRWQKDFNKKEQIIVQEGVNKYCQIYDY